MTTPSAVRAARAGAHPVATIEADTVGLDGILGDIRQFACEDALCWQRSPLPVDLVAQGRTFDSLNRPAD